MTALADIAHPHVPHLSRYEAGRPLEDVAREYGFDPAVAAKLASNENALGPSPMAVEAIRDAAARMHLYPDGNAIDLTHALAAKLDIAEECLVFGNGSNELIELLGHVALGPGRALVMSECAFVVYRLVASLFQADAIAVPMREHLHDLDAMLAAITPQTALLFVANPNNPTGTMVEAEALDRLIQSVPDHVIVVIDEAYVELLSRDRQPDMLRHVRAGRHVVLLRTFSKTYGLAGLRIGYAIAPPALAGLLQRVRQPFNVNAMAQAAALAALVDEAHVAKTRAMVQEGLAALYSEFERLGLPAIPSVANFVCVRVGDGRAVFRAMQAHGIIVRPMDVYGLPEYVRITVGTPDQNARCVAALEQAL